MNHISWTACGLALAAINASPAWAEDDKDDTDPIVVTGALEKTSAGTKTDTPLIETPQPITIIDAETYISQGAISVADTFRYVSGVQANTYGTDGRVDSNRIRGTSPLQFRDGMRDVYDSYASIRADPYNFSRIEVVRGPASVLFGQSSIGGIFNLVSKMPEFERHGDAAIVYGSFDRKEVMADLTGPLTDTIAARIVGRVRDSGTQVDHVSDDRVMVAPSIKWRPGPSTDVTLLGLYQEDDGGSQSTFLPLIGTLFENPVAGQLPNDTFPGTPGFDRYDGRLLQGTGIVEQRLGDTVKLSLKARYIDSHVDYFSQYPNSYSNPRNPYGADGRSIRLSGNQTFARMKIFSTDNNVQWRFNTGAQVEHLLLAGVDYSWNKIDRSSTPLAAGTFANGVNVIDLYDPTDPRRYDMPTLAATTTVTQPQQSQLGFYAQDQIRFWDRVSVVVGLRHDDVTTKALGRADTKDKATTFRAGIIGELGWGISPFFSYTESFLPITGNDPQGNPYVPQFGRQLEGGVKWAPDQYTLVNATAFHIKDRNRLITNPNPNPTDPFPTASIQAGEVISKGYELEASRVLPEDFELRLNYSFTKARNANGTPVDNLAKNMASAWLGKTIRDLSGWQLRLGGGVRYVGESKSYGLAWVGSTQAPDGTIITPDVTLFDALVEVRRDAWSFAINANNLTNKKFYAACLARGDCFIGAERNIFGTLRYRF
ncbi:TonB-dependent siderophore receptor [Novosphingobium sp. AP12]|uniref:TonB-dependent siderophore receptor n=1 Tax=Novosphingobium sp. AP12 TaxID=1144305 RepID=UPI000271FFA1|nr:TonB-dependent siderophore receptor [Novosphingobium sp. AP12]